ncbi:DsbE family thiol:disulfide interchange protein [Thioclava sp. BHET1]|nr:DsbE family thiol:disulfide interchange protein [Thioclava sp. BHET1]
MAKISPMIVVPPLVFAGLAVVFWVGMHRSDPDRLPSMLTNKPAPAVELTQLGDSKPFSDADLRDGKVKVVNFWASWCQPCRQEAAMLDHLSAQGLTIYGANYKDKPGDALGFLAEVGDPFAKIGADEKGQMAINWGVYGVPETFVIDGKGKVLLRYPGPITEDVLKTQIEPALKQAKADG